MPCPSQQSGLLQAFNGYVAGNFNYAWANWKSLAREPRNLGELALVAECLADRGDESALPYIDQLQKILPTEAEAIRARLLWRAKRMDQATATVQQCIKSLRTDPWPSPALVDRTMNLAIELMGADSGADNGQEIFRLLQQPFAVYNSDGTRTLALLSASRLLDHGRPGRNVWHTIETLEPNIPWTFSFLQMRSNCYATFEPALAAGAESDLVDFLVAAPGGLEAVKLPTIQAPVRVASAER